MLIALALAVMVVLAFGNVVLRYAFNSGITVSEEVSRWLFAWLTFLGAIVALKEHGHLGSDVLVSRLAVPPGRHEHHRQHPCRRVAAQRAAERNAGHRRDRAARARRRRGLHACGAARRLGGAHTGRGDGADILAVHGVGSSRIYFVDRHRDVSIYDVDFTPIPTVDPRPPALTGLHWFGIVQYIGHQRMEDWTEFYRELFGFKALPEEQRYGILPKGRIQQMPLPKVAERARRGAVWLAEDLLNRSVPLPNRMRLRPSPA